MKRRPLRAAVYLVAVTAGLLAAGELACRLGWVPNTAHALRRRAQAQAAHGRVLVLGDSFSVEEADPRAGTLGNQLRARLEARGAAVVNLAVQGYGPADEQDALARFAADSPDYRPDILLVNYFTGNDLTDTLIRMSWGGPRVPLAGHPWLQRSWLLRFVARWWQTRQVEAGAERIRRTQMQLLLAAPVPAARQALNPYLVDLARRLPDFLMLNLLMEGSGAERAWQENQRILRTLHAWAAERGARMVIAILPHTLQVNGSHQAFLQELGFRFDPRLLGASEPQRRLQAFCAAEGIVCSDLLPAFRARDEELYLPNDDHWRTPGHTLAANEIDRTLAPLLP